MSKRLVVTVLWFLMGWTIGSFVAFLAGLPVNSGLIVGVPFAALVWWDPAHVLWTRPRPADRRRARPVNDFVEDLDHDVQASAERERFPL